MAEEFEDTNLPAANESHVSTPASLPMSEMQMRLAAERPRDEVKVFNGAINELQMMPDYADEAYYSIPYKDKKKDGSEKIVMVEGLSIKAAMSLARRWGNCANGARVADEREDRIICQGMFFDYETNMLTLRDMSVSKYLRTFKGQTVRLNSARLNMAILAGESKAVRNAILASLPPGLKDAYFQTARSLVINPPVSQGKKSETIEERIEKGKSFFVSKLSATKEEVESLVANWIADSDGKLTSEEILSNLIGLKNAVKDGQITIDAAMGRQEKTGAGFPQEKAAEPQSATS